MNFNPRPPHGGRPRFLPARAVFPPISIHAPHTGGDCRRPCGLSDGGDFNPRPPHGGRRGNGSGPSIEADFNPRPPHGGRRPVQRVQLQRSGISIHAPHTGGDRTRTGMSARRRYFNPRPPHGGRQEARVAAGLTQRFQSTPPTRGATGNKTVIYIEYRFQSTPPTRGATTAVEDLTALAEFQSTPPTRGATARPSAMFSPIPAFQSTPPTRGATLTYEQYKSSDSISIHAPHTGGDGFSAPFSASQYHFNPRPPHGGRQFPQNP